MSRLACGHDESALYKDEAGGISCRLCDEGAASEPCDMEAPISWPTLDDWKAKLETGSTFFLTPDGWLNKEGPPPVIEKPPTTAWRLRQRYTELGDLAIEKNYSYGDSALHPLRIFSDLPASAGIRVRLDDKLSRLRGNRDAFEEDPLKDLVGYMVLLMLAEEDEREGM